MCREPLTHTQILTMFSFSLHTPVISLRDSLLNIFVVLIQDKVIHVDTNVLRLRERERERDKQNDLEEALNSPLTVLQSTNTGNVHWLQHIYMIT